MAGNAEPKDRIVIEKDPKSPLTTCYHVTREMSTRGIMSLKYKPTLSYGCADEQEVAASHDEKLKSLAERLFDIPGVCNVSISRYQINVVRDLAFEVEPIETKVIEAITAIYFDGSRPPVCDFTEGSIVERKK